MIKRLILTFVLVFSAVFLGVFLSSFTPAQAPPEQPRPAAEEDSLSASSPEEDGYRIIDYNGRVSVIRVGDEVPDMIFSIYTKTLPEYDQEQLREGVYVESYEELMRRVEDYTS